MVRTILPWLVPLLALACNGCTLPGPDDDPSSAVMPEAESLAEPPRQVALAATVTPPEAPPPPAPLAETAPAPPVPALPVVVHEIRRNAQPRTIEVAVGQPLEFVNEDCICHGFFSSSAPNAFDVGVLPPQGRATVRFEHPGTLQVYCSLHQHRQLTIRVVARDPGR